MKLNIKNIIFYAFLLFFGVSFLTLFINNLVNIEALNQWLKPEVSAYTWGLTSSWFIEILISSFIILAIPVSQYFIHTKKKETDKLNIFIIIALFSVKYLFAIIENIILISYLKSLGTPASLGVSIAQIVFEFLAIALLIASLLVEFNPTVRRILYGVLFVAQIIIFSLQASESTGEGAIVAILFFDFFAILASTIYLLVHDIIAKKLPNFKLPAEEKTVNAAETNKATNSQIKINDATVAELKNIKELYDQGIITLEEYENLKRNLLNL